MTDNENNFELVDQIESDAYVLLAISCTICAESVMAEDIDVQAPCDPMIPWAKEFSLKAKSLGWVVSKHGSIICPRCAPDYV